jgi:hypothetical protein
MDVYCFGMLMWEIFHEILPFDRKLKECIKLVKNDNCRPKIMYNDDENS